METRLGSGCFYGDHSKSCEVSGKKGAELSRRERQIMDALYSLGRASAER